MGPGFGGSGGPGRESVSEVRVGFLVCPLAFSLSRYGWVQGSWLGVWVRGERIVF